MEWSPIDREIEEELKKSSNFTSRGAIKLRILFKIADYLQISRDEIYETKDMLRINSTILKAFENLWNGFSLVREQDSDDYDAMDINILDFMVEKAEYALINRRQQKNTISKEDCDFFHNFLSRDFCRPCDVFKAVNLLKKRMCLLFDGDTNAIVLRKSKRNLWCVFGVDGLSSDADDELNPYYSNLSLSLTFGEKNHPSSESPEIEFFRRKDASETHVRAIRTLYREVYYATPERIGSVLKRWLGLERDPCSPSKGKSDVEVVERKRRRSSSCSNDGTEGVAGSDNADNEDEADEEDDATSSSSSSSSAEHLSSYGSDDYILNCYKRFVGDELRVVANFVRQRFRTRQIEASQRKDRDAQQKKRRAAAATTRKSSEPRSSGVAEGTNVQRQADERKEKMTQANAVSKRNTNHAEVAGESVAAVAKSGPSSLKMFSDANKKNKKGKSGAVSKSFKMSGNPMKSVKAVRKTPTEETVDSIHPTAREM